MSPKSHHAVNKESSMLLLDITVTDITVVAQT